MVLWVGAVVTLIVLAVGAVTLWEWLADRPEWYDPQRHIGWTDKELAKVVADHTVEEQYVSEFGA